MFQLKDFNVMEKDTLELFFSLSDFTSKIRSRSLSSRSSSVGPSVYL